MVKQDEFRTSGFLDYFGHSTDANVQRLQLKVGEILYVRFIGLSDPTKALTVCNNFLPSDGSGGGNARQQPDPDVHVCCRIIPIHVGSLSNHSV